MKAKGKSKKEKSQKTGDDCLLNFFLLPFLLLTSDSDEAD